jgi:hypothetical protein
MAMLEVARSPCPNLHVVGLFDTLLERNGALLRTLRDWEKAEAPGNDALRLQRRVARFQNVIPPEEWDFEWDQRATQELSFAATVKASEGKQVANSKSPMDCPACGQNIKLRAISPRNNAIRVYPAVRPCPSCHTPLVFNIPQWVIWGPVLLGMVVLGAGLLVLDSMNLLPEGRTRLFGAPWEFVALVAAVTAIIVASVVWASRSQMKITPATHDDIQRLAGR